MIANTDEIKRAAGTAIAEIIGKRIPLKHARHGDHFEGSCPFHNSASGKSFHVNPGKQSWYCWGCHTGGNVSQFIMDYERVSFPEALEILASELNIQVIYDSANHSSATGSRSRQDIMGVINAACEWYEKQLFEPRNAHALDYMKKRGFAEPILKKYRIGYAMGHSLLNAGLDTESLLEAGLIKRSETPARPLYDPMENRIVIPIMDPQNRPIAFAGRLLGTSDRPKYLNTPNSPVFKKGRSLFGYKQAKTLLSSITAKKTVYIIEGQLKCIAMLEAGYPCVAAGGTAFSEQQTAMLSQLAARAVVIADPDQAGTKAAVTTARALRQAEIETEIGMLDRTEAPELKDPDDLLARGLPIRIESQPLIDWLYYQICKGKCQTPEQARRVSREILPVIREHPLAAVQVVETRTLSVLSGIPEGCLDAPDKNLPLSIKEAVINTHPTISHDLPPERMLVAIVLQTGPGKNPDWVYSIPLIELPPFLNTCLTDALWTFRYAWKHQVSVADSLPFTVLPERLPWYNFWLIADINGEASIARARQLALDIIIEGRKQASMSAAKSGMLELSTFITSWR